MENLEKIREAVINAHDVKGNPRDTSKGSPYRVYQLCAEKDTVRLADVLLALQDRAWAKIVLELIAIYDLKNDDLSHQSEETLSFIASLL